MSRNSQQASRSAPAAQQPGHQPAVPRRATRGPGIGPAPGRLELVRAFVNTLDIEAGTDEFSSPAALAAWLRDRDLIGSGHAGATQDDLRRAIAMRAALREVLSTHVGAQALALAPVSELRSAVAGVATRLEIGDDGAVRSVPDGNATGAGLAALLLIAADAATLGTWTRLKVCSADDCRWAFYDRSPTRNGCWCSMAVCGSRAKSRAYRQRAAAQRPPDSPRARDRG
jgi:predicted RNA-binding Zn ribbon-like protein